MRRFVLMLAASIGLAALVPVTAQARRHGAQHNRHHAKAHKVRFQHFGKATSPSATGTNPSPGKAGMVQSFDGTGKLTILLSDGTTTASGLLTSSTQLRCPSSSSSTGSSDDNDADDQSTTGSQDNDDTTSGSHDSDDTPGASHDSGKHSDGQSRSDQNGSDQGGSDDEQGSSTQSCSTSSLIPGAAVQEAVLRISSSGASWDKVVLGS